MKCCSQRIKFGAIAVENDPIACPACRAVYFVDAAMRMLRDDGNLIRAYQQLEYAEEQMREVQL